MSLQPDKTKLLSEHKHNRPLTNCVWDPQSRYVFFGAEDNHVHRLDVQSSTLAELSAHDSWVRALGVSPDGRLLFAGGYDGRLALWPVDTSEPKPQTVIDAHQGWIRALAVSPNGERVATCGNDRLIKIWKAADLSLEKTLTGHGSHVYNVGFTKDGNRLFSCDLHGAVKSWSITPPNAAKDMQSPVTESAGTDSDAAADKTAEMIDIVKAESLAKYDTTFRADIGGARSLCLNDDGTILALGGITNVTNAFAGIGEVVVVLVDWQQKKIKLQLECKDKQRGTIWGTAYHPDGYWIAACGGSGGFLIFWKPDAAQEVFKMKLKSEARGMSLSPDGSKIAVAHSDSHLRIYSL